MALLSLIFQAWLGLLDKIVLQDRKAIVYGIDLEIIDYITPLIKKMEFYGNVVKPTDTEKIMPIDKDMFDFALAGVKNQAMEMRYDLMAIKGDFTDIEMKRAEELVDFYDHGGAGHGVVYLPFMDAAVSNLTKKCAKSSSWDTKLYALFGSKATSYTEQEWYGVLLHILNSNESEVITVVKSMLSTAIATLKLKIADHDKI